MLSSFYSRGGPSIEGSLSLFSAKLLQHSRATVNDLVSVVVISAGFGNPAWLK